MELKATLEELKSFVQQEHEAGLTKLQEIWEKPLASKLASGETQAISSLNLKERNTVWAKLGEGESRFREGDMIRLHLGDVNDTAFLFQATIEAEYDNEWLLSGRDLHSQMKAYAGGPCYADVDSMDLKPFYTKALSEIAESKIGRKIILPLLAGKLKADDTFSKTFDNAATVAEEMGLNEDQQNAVGFGVAARYIACIQGPPGTGKTKVISLIAKLLVEEGQSVLLTSHTHMAINNALNKIYKENVPVAKIGSASSTKALDSQVKRFEHGNDWGNRPTQGYVIGATPFATCSKRLENFEFDTVIFDEASQITVPLAVMAMRKAKRYVFVGDHKQLPPVVLSKSVIDTATTSVFAKLISQQHETTETLYKTYRLNQWLSCWPSKIYYHSKLSSTGPNRNRTFDLPNIPSKYQEVLSKDNAIVFIKSPGTSCRTVNQQEAQLVHDITQAALAGGLQAKDIGIVTPFRSHARRVKNLISGITKGIVTDTVERMQGQERELIILSMCATDSLFIKNIASFFFQPERLNVAVTRPMTKLIIVGPQLDPSFQADDEKVMQWVEWYRSLIDHAQVLEAKDL
ncbi:AAA domain-containing protein [Zooshikella harenae]|uniref:AAA family ATPase n=1 Tax=Zooshikella harenae TaxID=2827238 RepID=A0ABS5ZC91_9GAMM|nr:AAA domain-containing protein [Zooshikella harenae]MBU2711635.1 AAA family ATPase [Zooshikella harenae]